FGDEVRPLPLSTNRRELSRLISAAVGYQPVGMKPWTSLWLASLTSTTATVLLSAFATTRRFSSGDRLTAFGVDPGGASGKIDTFTCSTALRFATSTTHTALVLAHATNSRRPSRVSAIAFGCSPTGISPFASSVWASNSSTRAPPHSETNSVVP